MFINGYDVTELKPDNSGYAKWGFGRRNGREFFIKQFLSPVYPAQRGELSDKQVEQKKSICKDFEFKKRSFYNQLNRCVTGNIVTIDNFFREDSKYYMVTDKVDAAKIDVAEISRMNIEQKSLITKVLLHSVATLHRVGIVHGDIKPDNILYKKTLGDVYTAKLIDFDSSFLESMPPMDEDEFQGDMVYLAPESFLLIAEEEVRLTGKIDVFALGILLHQYFTGELPQFDQSQYDYVFEAVLDGALVSVSPRLPEFMKGLISKMLLKNPEDRPSCQQVYEEVMKIYGPKARPRATMTTVYDRERTDTAIVTTEGGLKMSKQFTKSEISDGGYRSGGGYTTGSVPGSGSYPGGSYPGAGTSSTGSTLKMGKAFTARPMPGRDMDIPGAMPGRSASSEDATVGVPKR